MKLRNGWYNMNKRELNQLSKELHRRYIERQADAFIERYGICEYTITGDLLIYYRNGYESIYDKKPTTYKFVVNLATGESFKGIPLKRINKKGCYN